MFPSTLIVSRSPEASLARAVELTLALGHVSLSNNPDIFIIGQDRGYSIQDVRAALSFLSQKPYNHPNKIILVLEAQNLQNEAQNALLKTLEEPGENNYLILTVSNVAGILPTILSRCQIIKSKDAPSSVTGELIKITGNLKDDLAITQTLAGDKDQALVWLSNQLSLCQQQLVKHPSPETARLLKKIIKAINMINANVDYKSALDYLFLS